MQRRFDVGLAAVCGEVHEQVHAQVHESRVSESDVGWSSPACATVLVAVVALDLMTTPDTTDLSRIPLMSGVRPELLPRF